MSEQDRSLGQIAYEAKMDLYFGGKSEWASLPPFEQTEIIRSANAVAAHVRAPLDARIAALEAKLKQCAAIADKYSFIGCECGCLVDNPCSDEISAALKGGSNPDAIEDPLVEAALKGAAT